MKVSAEVLAELEAIDTAREAAFTALGEANRRGVTGADAKAAHEAFKGVEDRVEALQRRVWPRYRGKLIVALGSAILVSPTGRSSRLVWARDPRQGPVA